MPEIYKQELAKPLFSMYKDLSKWVEDEKNNIDLFLVNVASFGSKPIVEKSGVNFINFMPVPPSPVHMDVESDVTCRYPNIISPPSLKDLKNSLSLRVKNQVLCRLLDFYVFLISNYAVNELYIEHAGINLLEERGLKSLKSYVNAGPQTMSLGGPPMNLKFKMDEKVHVLGILSKPKLGNLPEDMQKFLDQDNYEENENENMKNSASFTRSDGVLYISMGTVFEFTDEDFMKLVEIIESIPKKHNLRVLWSLKEAQQNKMKKFLPAENDFLKIEKFTPQPTVLKHNNVKIFLSHCGFGGVVDSVSAGVPIIAFPGGSDQNSNAQTLVDLEAAVILNKDFSNFHENLDFLLNQKNYEKYSKNTKNIGQTLKSYGGIAKAVEIMESAAEGKITKPDQKLFNQMNDIDPFFEIDQTFEKILAFGLMAFVVGILPLTFCLIVKFCCCRSDKKKYKNE